MSWIGYASAYHLLKDYDTALYIISEYKKNNRVILRIFFFSYKGTFYKYFGCGPMSLDLIYRPFQSYGLAFWHSLYLRNNLRKSNNV